MMLCVGEGGRSRQLEGGRRLQAGLTGYCGSLGNAGYLVYLSPILVVDWLV